MAIGTERLLPEFHGTRVTTGKLVIRKQPRFGSRPLGLVSEARRRTLPKDQTSNEGELPMLKVFGWIILIIFIIGLLVVTGVLKLIF